MNNMIYTPNYAVPPGKTIDLLLKKLKKSIDSLAEDLFISPKEINELLNGNRAINSNIADKLSSSLGGTSSFWLNREKQYREDIQRLSIAITEDEQKWLDIFPQKYILKIGQNFSAYQKLVTYFNFFAVNSLNEWRCKYEKELIASAAFRTSTSFDSNLGSTVTWLRQSEIEAEKIICKHWNKDLLEQKLTDIRALTLIEDPNIFIPQLREICAECGVAIVTLKCPQGCYASGVAKFINSKKIMISLSLRHLQDDHFWFTLFHELGHLILHSNKALRTFIEISSEKDNKEIEIEANEFAKNVLIPKQYFDECLQLGQYKDNKKLGLLNIKKFAKKINISPGVIVGQLQYYKIIPANYFNVLKVSYKKFID